MGKGNKVRYAAISPTLSGKLLAYAYHKDIKPDQRIFPTTSTRAWQILHRAFQTTGIRNPDQEGSVHVLRHFGALARLEATGYGMKTLAASSRCPSLFLTVTGSPALVVYHH